MSTTFEISLSWILSRWLNIQTGFCCKWIFITHCLDTDIVVSNAVNAGNGQIHIIIVNYHIRGQMGWSVCQIYWFEVVKVADFQWLYISVTGSWSWF